MSDQITDRIPPENPASTPTPHPQGSQKALVLGFILFALVAIGLGGYFIYDTVTKVKKGPPSRSTPELGEPIGTFSTEDLHREFDENPIAFEKKYIGKTIQVAGRVAKIREIEPDKVGKSGNRAFVWLVLGAVETEDYSTKGTLCYFASTSDVTSFRNGGRALITGMVSENSPEADCPRLIYCKGVSAD